MNKKTFTVEQLEDLMRLHFLHEKITADATEDSGLEPDEADEYDQLCDKIGEYLPIDGF